jgi:uncharacterized protein
MTVYRPGGVSYLRIPAPDPAGRPPSTSVFVDDLDDTQERISATGGQIATPPYVEGDLRVATFRDPAGNVVGAWERRPPS